MLKLARHTIVCPAIDLLLTIIATISPQMFQIWQWSIMKLRIGQTAHVGAAVSAQAINVRQEIYS